MYKHKSGLILKKITQDELELMMYLKNESWQSVHTTRFLNQMDQVKWFEKVTTDPSYLVLIAFKDNTPVGVFKIDSIDLVNRSCNVGWDIFEKHRGKGLGKLLVQAGVDFCFEVYNLHRITAEILVTNEASIKCAVFAKFKLEGMKRKSVYKLGTYIDSNIYGVLLEDWL